jgi:hypothetical protein
MTNGPLNPVGLLCTCTGREGFTRIWDEFVCAACHQPRPGYEEKTVGLAYFQGGPLDGRVYTVKSLMSTDALAINDELQQYKWTSGKIKSERTGQTARVWLWIGDVSGQPAAVPTQEDQVMTATTDNDYLVRRQKLGLSRPEVVVHTDGKVTVAQLSTVEKGGPRVKEDIRTAVDAALSKLEAQAGVSTDAQAAPEVADPEA